MPKLARKDTGVYGLKHRASGKIYVGSTAGKGGFSGRFKGHRDGLNKETHHSRYLQRAWNRYGSKAFVFVILERCTSSKCLEREQYWMDYYNSADSRFGYNMCPVAGTCLGYKHTKESIEASASKRRGQKRSEETNQRVSESLKKHWAEKDRQAWSEMMRNIVLSDEARAVKSATGKANKGTKRSEETKARMRAKWADPEFRAMMIDKRLNRSEESRAKTSDTLKKVWGDPEKKAAIVEKRRRNRETKASAFEDLQEEMVK